MINELVLNLLRISIIDNTRQPGNRMLRRIKQFHSLVSCACDKYDLSTSAFTECVTFTFFRFCIDFSALESHSLIASPGLLFD